MLCDRHRVPTFDREEPRDRDGSLWDDSAKGGVASLITDPDIEPSGNNSIQSNSNEKCLE
jgi:hypothetical protein